MVALALDESHIIGIGIDYSWPISIIGIHPMPIIVYYCNIIVIYHSDIDYS
jgi:hypothetical protein